MRYARVTAPPDRSHRRIEFRPPQPCARCGGWFTPSRTDAVFCSARCKQAAWRASRPRTWALVWWVADRHNDLHACWSYHLTAEHARRAAASAPEPNMIVNIANKPSVTLPNIEELIRRSRPLLEQRRDAEMQTRAWW
jgi:hypothetical protein